MCPNDCESRMVPASDGDPAAEDWVAVKALAVLAGNSAQVACSITAGADAAGLTATQRHGTDACIGYLTSNRKFCARTRPGSSGPSPPA
jgi:hypothetical protein